METYPKCVFTGFFLITAACGAAPYFVRNRFGQTIIIDPEKRTLCIKWPARETVIRWHEKAARFLRDRSGQAPAIDPETLALCYKKPARETIGWSEIVALQLCLQTKPSRNYQLILVWRSANQGFERHCLAAHQTSKRCILRLARTYESLLSLELTDETQHSQPDTQSSPLVAD